MFKFRNKNADMVEMTVSNRTVVRVLVMVVATMLGLSALEHAQHALVLIGMSLFLALAFNAPVHWLAQRLPGKRRGNRTLATTLSLLFLLAVLGLFLASVVPPVIRQTSGLIDSAPRLLNELTNQDSSVGSVVEKYRLGGYINELSNELSSRLGNTSGAVSALSQASNSVFNVLAVLAMTFMMLVEGPRWVAWFKRLVPREKAKDADRLAGDMYQVVKGYVNGQVTLAAIAAVLIFPMFLILGISYPFALMFVVFICGLVPMIGHTVGAILVTLIALTNSLAAAVIILAYYILYQQIENYAVQPKVQANSTDLSPLMVFIAVVVGVSFSGLLGGLVAIPIMGCLRVILLYYLDQREDVSLDAAAGRAK
ncbi:hypothetical protein CR970_01510 [Candidatus Saccharibacteria bacterium]|nr:MAG: hypothetical protein CR970_01510 [Candidatus Saccharibacteria bacterium]